MSNIRPFRDLPTGTRFRYPESSDVWVVLERHGCGLIAKWKGVDYPSELSAVCSFADSVGECETRSVVVCEDDQLLERAIRSAAPLGAASVPRWAVVMDMFGLGSTSAAELCNRFSIDPGTVLARARCGWELDLDSGLYRTDCDVTFMCPGGSPAEDGFEFCPSCGRPVREEGSE